MKNMQRSYRRPNKRSTKLAFNALINNGGLTSPKAVEGLWRVGTTRNAPRGDVPPQNMCSACHVIAHCTLIVTTLQKNLHSEGQKGMNLGTGEIGIDRGNLDMNAYKTGYKLYDNG